MDNVIVTVTLNAALDVFYEVDQVSWGSASQISRVRYRAGGRGVAVAKVLHTFGHDVVAAGLVGGVTGEMIGHELSRSGIPAAFTSISAESRRVLQLTDTVQGRTSWLREPGPYVTTEELGRFAADYRRLLADATAVVLCGSLPAGLPAEIYASLASYAAEANVPVILNTGGDALWHGAARKPDLVIPDAAATGGGGSVAETAGARASDAGGAAEGSGADSGLLGLGVGGIAIPIAGGVRVVTGTERWTARLCAPTAAGMGISASPMSRSLGALVAGLVPGLLLGWSWPDRLRHAVAVAAAADGFGEVDLAAYESHLDNVIIDAPT